MDGIKELEDRKKTVLRKFQEINKKFSSLEHTKTDR